MVERDPMEVQGEALEGDQPDYVPEPLDGEPMDFEAASAEFDAVPVGIDGEPVEVVDEVAEEPAQAEVVAPADAKGAGNAAFAAMQSVAQGFSAVRQVRAASKQHSSAKTQLKEMQEALEGDRATLDHRIQIEQDYEQIVSEATLELSEAQAAVDDAIARIQALDAERASLAQQLESLHAANEEELRPYKNLMDSAKGRSDDAAVALADAKRAVKSAESQLSDATRRRDQRISAANRSVDNAQERLRRVQTEIDKLQGDAATSPTALPKMRDELSAERTHLSAAREEVARVTAETQQAVEAAQQQLWAHKEALSDVEQQAEEAKREAAARREEYDRLYKQAKAAEGELEDQIKARAKTVTEIERERELAASRIEAAQATLDEADEIHATPEVTAELADRVTAAQREIDLQQQEVKRLARETKHLRKTTRRHRIAFFAALIAIVLVLALLVWFFAFRPTARSGQTTSNTPVATQTQTSNDAGKPSDATDDKDDAAKDDKGDSSKTEDEDATTTDDKGDEADAGKTDTTTESAGTAQSGKSN